MSEKVWIFHCNQQELSQWVQGRDVSEATVIEYLIEHYLDELDTVFPREDDPEYDRDIKADLRYERLVDERMGF